MPTATWIGVICWTLVLCLEAEAGLPGLPSWLEEDRCYEFDISLCRSYGYNQTALPNWLGQRTELEAVLHLGALMPLIETGCSSELRFLLCVLYLPVCLHDPNNGNLLDVKPCRQLCERVHNRCVNKVKRKGEKWLTNFSCNDLPDAENRDNICFDRAPSLLYVEGSLAPRSSVKPTSVVSKSADASVLMTIVVTTVCGVVVILLILFVCYMKRKRNDNEGGSGLANRRPSMASDTGLLPMPNRSCVQTWISELPVPNGDVPSSSHVVYMKSTPQDSHGGRSDISTGDRNDQRQ